MDTETTKSRRLTLLAGVRVGVGSQTARPREVLAADPARVLLPLLRVRGIHTHIRFVRVAARRARRIVWGGPHKCIQWEGAAGQRCASRVSP